MFCCTISLAPLRPGLRSLFFHAHVSFYDQQCLYGPNTLSKCSEKHVLYQYLLPTNMIWKVYTLDNNLFLFKGFKLLSRS